MGRIEDLELEMESLDSQLQTNSCDNRLHTRQDEVLEQLDSLSGEGFPELSDTNELP